MRNIKKVLTIDEVKHVANLANLTLSNEELSDFKTKLSVTIDNIKELKKIDTKGVLPTPQVTEKTNEFREDIALPSLSQENALKNAKRVHNGFFVTKIVWNE